MVKDVVDLIIVLDVAQSKMNRILDTPAQIMFQELQCSECKTGTMIYSPPPPSNMVLLSQYRHVCNNCGTVETLGTSYPRAFIAIRGKRKVWLMAYPVDKT